MTAIVAFGASKGHFFVIQCYVPLLVEQGWRLTVLAEGVPQVVNGILDGALASDPGLHGEAQDRQHAQSAIAHLHTCQLLILCKKEIPAAADATRKIILFRV
jgi:hypothetical protein